MATPDREVLRERSLDRALPSSSESERAILGGILLNNSLLSEAIEVLTVDDFYSPLNRRIYAAMLALFERGDNIDPIVIGEELKKDGGIDAIGGVAAISALTYGLPHFSRIKDYAKIVKDKSMLRNLVKAANEIASLALSEEEAADQVIEQAEQKIFALGDARLKDGFSPLEPLATEVIEKVRQHAENNDRVFTGLQTYFEKLDNLTSGLQKSDLFIIAARPSMGKTAFALTLAQNCAVKGGAVVAVFSLEMSKHQLVTRLLSAQARVDQKRFRGGVLIREEWTRLAEAIGELASTRMFIDDTPGISAMEMRAKLRRLKTEQKKLDLVVVDYLQLMSGSQRTESRQQEVSQISRELKALAKEFDVPLIALSQLSRAPEARNPPRPMLSDLRESGSIEQDADVVAFIYRPEYYTRLEEDSGKAELIVSKHRNGPTGLVPLTFVSRFTRFENYIGEYNAPDE